MGVVVGVATVLALIRTFIGEEAFKIGRASIPPPRNKYSIYCGLIV